MVKTMGVIFVDRSRKRDVTRVNELQAQGMNKYQGVVLFPEGTTSDGSQILPLRSPLLEFPVQDNLPVHYATIHYKTGEGYPSAGESVCWAGGGSFPGHVYKLVSNRRIEGTIRFGDEPVRSRDRKKLTALLQEKLNRQFILMLER
jgi:1-acyl-sn-glycerol-3-phosphate acyltransferase